MVDSDPGDLAQAASDAAAALRLVLAACEAPTSIADRLREAYLRGALHALEALTATDSEGTLGLSDDPPSSA